MPNLPHKVEHIGAALRTRFFSLVPKVENPNRSNWTETQHDKDRLTRALAAYCLVHLCDLEDAESTACIIDGSNDGGIDALYFDNAQKKLFIVQSKYKTSSPAQDEVLKTINGFRALWDRNWAILGTVSGDTIDNLEEALETPGVQLELVFAYLGEHFNLHAQADLDALLEEKNAIQKIVMWQQYPAEDIHQWLVEEQQNTSVNTELVLENWAGVSSPQRAYYGLVTAEQLANLMRRHGKLLFERNIRHYLGSGRVNDSIVRTAHQNPTELFYLNNGITAIAHRVIQATGTRARCRFGLTTFSIVNGAQTVGAIASAFTNGANLSDAKVMMTIIEVPPDDTITGIKITRARNHQNQIHGVDFAALDPNQELIRQELASVQITYHYRPSAEARVYHEDALTIEDAALAIACLGFPIKTSLQIFRQPIQNNAVDFITTAKRQIGLLWNQSDKYYPELFPNGISGIHICRLVRIYRLIDGFLGGAEGSSRDYQRKMFFRHARYFIMAVIAHTEKELVYRPALNLSIEEKNQLSLKTDELAELVFQESAPFFAVRGYLSIFRNKTHTQGLADVVLSALAPARMPPAVSIPSPNSVESSNE